MNFITNPDPMIDKDPEVQAQLEIILFECQIKDYQMMMYEIFLNICEN